MQQDFPGGSDGKVSAYSAGDLGSIPGSGRSPGEENGNPLQYSCLEKSHGQRSLVGYIPWGHKELDTTEWLHFLSFLYMQQNKQIFRGFDSWINTNSHHWYQEIEHFHYPGSSFMPYFHWFPSSPQRQLLFGVLKHILLSHILEFHLNGSISVYSFVPGFFYWTQCFWHPCCCVIKYFIPFYCWVVFHYTNMLQFIYSPVSRHLGCFQFETIKNQTALNIFAQDFLWIISFR